MTDTTANLGLTKPVVEGSDGAWGDLLNGDLDLIDAFAGKMPIMLSNGVISSAGLVNLALPSTYTAFRLEIGNLTSPNSAMFARFSLDGGSTYLTTDYDYVRSDLSAKAGGIQTFASGIGDVAIMLTDSMKSQTLSTDTAGFVTVEINNNQATAGHGRISLKTFGTYFNNDGPGYRTHSQASGALTGQTGPATNVQLGGYNSGVGYANGIRCSYALFGVPGLA